MGLGERVSDMELANDLLEFPDTARDPVKTTLSLGCDLDFNSNVIIRK